MTIPSHAPQQSDMTKKTAAQAEILNAKQVQSPVQDNLTKTKPANDTVVKKASVLSRLTAKLKRKLGRDDKESRPAIFMRPPWFFAIGAVFAFIFEMEMPTRWAHPPYDAKLGALGAICGMIAILVLNHCSGQFRRHKTNIDPMREDSALITTGLYKRTRNPVYLGLIAAYLSLALILESVWAVLFLGPVIWALHYQIVLKEEAYLEKRFGQAYLDYKAKTKRWLWK